MRNTVEVKLLCYSKIILHFDLNWVIQDTGDYAIIWNKNVESYHIKKSNIRYLRACTMFTDKNMVEAIIINIKARTTFHAIRTFTI